MTFFSENNLLWIVIAVVAILYALILISEKKGKIIDISSFKIIRTVIYILADDRRKLLMDVSIALQECDVNVKNLSIKTTKDNKAVFNTTVCITEKGQMNRILTKLKNVPGVLEAYRATT